MTSLLDISATLSLTDDLDKELLVVLRDGGNFQGTLCSFDQFGSLVLKNTIQRYFVGNKFCEKKVGLFFVRGDTIQMLGQVDSEKEKLLESTKWQQVNWEEMKKLRAEESKMKSAALELKLKIQAERGVPKEDLLQTAEDL